MSQVIEAIFNGEVFTPLKPIKLAKNTKVKIIIDLENQANLSKLSESLLLPDIDEDESIFIRDKDTGRDIDL